MIDLLSFVLVAFLGFTAHRASLCTVRAVAEIFSTGRAYMLASFGKAVLWVMVISLPLMWFWPAQGASGQGYAPAAVAVVGGFLFGAGAAINGGCSFSTLQRLADGDLWMVATLLGYCAGVAGWSATSALVAIPSFPPQPFRGAVPESWAWVVLGALWMWAAWELWRLWRTRDNSRGLLKLAGASRYRLSTAAAILGLGGGFLYALQGTWTYTYTLRSEIMALLGHQGAPTSFQMSLFLALLAGMVISSWQRRDFKLQTKPAEGGFRRFLGGTLMGLGAAVVPGGNDTLLLKAIPTLTPYALPTYVALVAGVASVLLLRRWVRGEAMRVDCSGDICGRAKS